MRFPVPPTDRHVLLLEPVLDRPRPCTAHAEYRGLRRLAEFDQTPGRHNPRAAEPAPAVDDNPLPAASRRRKSSPARFKAYSNRASGTRHPRSANATSAGRSRKPGHRDAEGDLQAKEDLRRAELPVRQRDLGLLYARLACLFLARLAPELNSSNCHPPLQMNRRRPHWQGRSFHP